MVTYSVKGMSHRIVVAVVKNGIVNTIISLSGCNAFIKLMAFNIEM